jgi:type II secretory pathway component PulF
MNISRGQSLKDALKTTHELPPMYRLALETWIHDGETPAAFMGLVMQQRVSDEMGRDVRFALTQPLILAAIGFLGFVYLCVFTAPKLAALYTQMWKPPAAFVSLLMVANETLPVWGTAVPIVLFAIWLWLRLRGPSLGRKGLPGNQSYRQSLQKSYYADQIAHLLKNDYSLSQALTMIGPWDTAPQASSETMQNVVAASGSPRDALHQDASDPTVGAAMPAMPPLVSWAISQAESRRSQITALQIAANIYRTIATRYEVLWRTWFPAVTGAVFGGAIVLLYGLSVFLPVIEFLKELTIPEVIE